jgi:acetyl esterase/lipase
MDIPYGTGNGRDLCLDIYAPGEAASQRAAVLMFHGGGWRRGSRKSLEGHARALQAEGFTAIPGEYRLLGESPWPAPLHDVKAAIRWVRANAAELGIEPDRIVLESFSAGAHLSLLAAGTANQPDLSGDGGNPGVDESVAAVAVFYPPTTFHTGETRARGSVGATGLLGETATPEEAAFASPITHVSAAFPPTFFLHGGADRVVPPSASILMHEALRSAGVETDLHILAGLNHAFDYARPYREVVAREVSLFFRRMVSDKESIARQLSEQSPFPQGQSQAIGARI